MGSTALQGRVLASIPAMGTTGRESAPSTAVIVLRVTLARGVCVAELSTQDWVMIS